MKVDTMRKIDRWVGIPLTFLFSIPIWFVGLFARKKNPRIQRTLFIELSEMGSAILVDPAMRKLEKEGGSQLYFAIFENNAKSLHLLGTIPKERIFSMRSDNLWVMAIDVFRFIGWCRKKQITCTIDLELFSRFTALLSTLSMAGSRIGFATLHDEGLYRGNLINFPVRYNSHVHISVNFLALVNTALGLHDQAYPTHAVTPEELILARAEVKKDAIENVKSKIKALYPKWKGERLVLFNVNASDMLPQRKWLPEYFVQVGKVLLESFEDIIIVGTGAPAEREYVQNVIDQIAHSRCVNSAGAFSFEQLVPLYSISSLMLTNDSGPAHFAAVTSLKVFVIFGPETPELYGSLGNAENFYLGLPCSPCVSAFNHRKTSCKTRPCITGISPLWVQNKLMDFLNGKEQSLKNA